MTAHGIPGGTARVRGDISSQYFSALMQAAPYAAADVNVEVDGKLVSVPYVEMTAGTMAEFGVHVDVHGEAGFHVPSGQRYQAREYVVEPEPQAPRTSSPRRPSRADMCGCHTWALTPHRETWGC